MSLLSPDRSRRLRRLSAKLGFERDWYLILIATVIGLVMSVVAWAFITPLHLIEVWAKEQAGNRSLMFLLVPIAPVAGAFLAGFIIHIIGEANRAPGVSSVMFAIHRGQSRLSWRVAVRKWLAATATIGSGGSAGAEGPIVTIGSVIGSKIGQWLRTNPQNSATLLGCGAAAGIASVFNAPIAGIFFVMEILLRDFSLRTFTPIVISSVVSAAFTQTLQQSNEPLFGIAPSVFEAHNWFNVWEIPNFVILGLLCGVLAPIFVRSLFWTDGVFSKLRVNRIFKPVIGAALLGLIGLGYLLISNVDSSIPGSSSMPGFYGNGYPVITELLEPGYYENAGRLTTAGKLVFTLILLAVLKGVATCLTIGSGGAGGLFAPSLLLGATTGGAFGTIVVSLNWFESGTPAHYALVGMAAMIAALTHAPLTGILIVYEITQSYQIILPLMAAAVIATIVARLISHDSVYTWSLTRRGVRIGVMSDLTILRRLSVSDVPLTEPAVVHPDDSAQRLLDLSEEYSSGDFIVVDDHEHYVGFVTSADLRAALVYREAIPLLQVNEIQRSDLPTVMPEESLDSVLEKFSKHDVTSLAVLSEANDGEVRGIITRSRLLQTYQDALSQDS